jgi:MSHA biogenesis protein MshQ
MTDLVDNDGVGYCPVGSEPCLSGYSALSVPLSSVLELRYGRISVENGYGPEDIDYKLPLYVQTYLNGAFIQNADDNESNFSMLLGTAQDVTTEESYNLYVTSNNGSVFITGETQGADGIYLEVKNVVTEVYMEFINVPSYLNIDWNEDGAIDSNDRASANVILGTYRGNDRIIYKRER